MAPVHPRKARSYPGRFRAARYLPDSTPATASLAGSNDGRRPLHSYASP
jgi:hypothetical protein